MYLYDKLATLREYGGLKTLPDYIAANLNPSFELRPYQREAFENFITHFESANRPHPTQVLFHMATGSGKTLIMAGLILYLYERGYRNFLFFVNLSNIVDKTRENFLNAAADKYLFAKEIILGGKRVRVNVVENFQHADNDAINICFSTTQGLHWNMFAPSEGSMTFDDFAERKTVLISDEAHHLNVDTRNPTKADDDSRKTWEQTVKHIFTRNAENVLLEFTATCDVGNPLIRAEYEDKIIFDYPLQKFYNDGYSKDIITFRSELEPMDRALQALILSQYRLKLFQDNGKGVKPVVLFKARTIKESETFMKEFIAAIKNLTGNHLRGLSERNNDEILKRAFDYFAAKGISFDMLADELRDEFSELHCISANDDKDAAQNQQSLNSLEDSSNPCRAVFEVKKLDEGWDVLNLFDIVRLYETRQSGGKKISAITISEAQLIGRGARYCPFKLNDEQPKYQRKYDGDAANDLRICETLYYHCQNDRRYISELHAALHKIGLDVDKTVKRKYELKESFKADKFYNTGVIFINDREEIGQTFGELVPDELYRYDATEQSGRDKIMAAEVESVDNQIELHTVRKTIRAIAETNYAIVHRALMNFPALAFDKLKVRFPELKSTRQFINEYIGGNQIDITSRELEPSVATLYNAVNHVVRQILHKVNKAEKKYRGKHEFVARRLKEVFQDKTVSYSETVAGGLGTPQEDVDLSAADWFAYNDNFGTSEEKAFVAYFSKHIDELKARYSKIYLLRNERAFHVYAFDDGARFEPDYVLFLKTSDADDFEQWQIFIEPKGNHLIEHDSWKETFLNSLKDKAKVLDDGNRYRIWGLPFFNNDRLRDFDSAFRATLKLDS